MRRRDFISFTGLALAAPVLTLAKGAGRATPEPTMRPERLPGPFSLFQRSMEPPEWNRSVWEARLPLPLLLHPNAMPYETVRFHGATEEIAYKNLGMHLDDLAYKFIAKHGLADTLWNGDIGWPSPEDRSYARLHSVITKCLGPDVEFARNESRLFATRPNNLTYHRCYSWYASRDLNFPEGHIQAYSGSASLLLTIRDVRQVCCSPVE